jgi:hypothetical protein
VGIAVRLEVVREVLVGVAPLVGADDPDLLAAQLLAQRLEGADLVHAADHPPAGLTGVLEDQGGPVAEHPLVAGYALAWWVVGEPGVACRLIRARASSTGRWVALFDRNSSTSNSSIRPRR